MTPPPPCHRVLRIFGVRLVLAASSEASFESEMSTLVAEEASIVVLLAEAFDSAVVRTVLSQVRQMGRGKGGGGQAKIELGAVFVLCDCFVASSYVELL